MRYVLAIILPCFAMAALAAADDGSSIDWRQWRSLPVQDGGRNKPLDTMAWETFRMLGNRSGLADPETGEKLDGAALYVTMLFEWQGQAKPARHGMPGMAGYFDIHQPDKWDRAPLLLVGNLDLRAAIGMPAGEKYISPLELSQAKICDPQTGKESPFVQWAHKHAGAKKRDLSPFNREAVELALSLEAYQDHRMGARLGLIPIKGDEKGAWLPVATLLQRTFTEKDDPTGLIRQAKAQLQEGRSALLAHSPEKFNEASTALIATLAELGPQQGAYPAPETIATEVAYNHWVPFRFAWILTMMAGLFVLLNMGSGWKVFYGLSLVTFFAGLAAMAVGFAMRVAISGRAPVTNMYESVVYVALGTALLGLIFELIYRKGYVLAAAAVVSTVALVLADNAPAVLDPTLQPLTPVLRNNTWLVVHVMSITLSYAAFALALGIGDITLGYYLVRSKDAQAIAGLTRFTYRVLQAGVLLLAIGTFTGALWADFAWGRFWGWDPKEVWALIALLGYLAVLHARYIGVRDRGMAALSVVSFALVVMAWYGVNYVLPAGLHSYGFGGGGQGLVFTILGVQFLYVGLALLRSRNLEPEPEPAEIVEATLAASIAT